MPRHIRADRRPPGMSFADNAAIRHHHRAWVQCYAPELNKRCRRELKPTNGSWRVDETYVRAKRRSGFTCTAPSIPAALGLIFCSPPIVTRLPRSASSRERCVLRATRAPGNQCRRQPVIPQGGRRTEDSRKTGPAMSVSHLSLLEQHRGTGPPGDQAAGKCQPGVSVFPRSLADDSRLRSAHDPERPSEVVAKGDVVGLVLFINETLGLRGE